MIKSRSVLKNIRKSAKLRKVNRIKKRRLKDAIKKYTKTKTKKATEKMYPSVQSMIDKSIQDGLLKKNKAARFKARLSKRFHKQK
jgi:small subunit ribosomal protein S20